MAAVTGELSPGGMWKKRPYCTSSSNTHSHKTLCVFLSVPLRTEKLFLADILERGTRTGDRVTETESD